jgi:hypothetical protein
MKIELIRNTIIAGEAKSVGDVVEVDAVLASMLMATGKGIPAAEKKTLADRAVGLAASVGPKPKTREGKK